MYREIGLGKDIKDNAPADYCIIGSDPEHRLSQFERLTLVGGADLDRALSMIARQFAKGFDSNQKLGEVNIKEFIKAYEFYTQKKYIKDPHGFFPTPTTAPVVKETMVHGLKDGEIIDLEFESTYQVQCADFRDEFERFAENRTVHARMWRHFDKTSATMIAIHGWTMGDQRLNSLAFLPGLFYQTGLNVVLLELPYHGRRKSKSSPNLFPSADMMRTNEAMGQVISDLRELRRYLKTIGETNVGCIGMSLGAYSTALWASLDELSFAIPVVPLVSMGELAWDFLSRAANFEQLKANGLTREKLSAVYQVHCPLTYKPRVPTDRSLIIAGIGDEIVPARQPKLLWDHWKRPQIQWLSGGHSAQLKRTRAFVEIVNFLYGLGVANSKLTIEES